MELKRAGCAPPITLKDAWQESTVLNETSYILTILIIINIRRVSFEHQSIYKASPGPPDA